MYSVAGIWRMIVEVFLTLHLTASRPAHIQAWAASSGAARHDARTQPIAPNLRVASLSPSAKGNLSANHDTSEPILGAARRRPATCSPKGCGRLSARSRLLQRSQLAGAFTRGSKPLRATLIATAAQSRLSDNVSTPAQHSAPNATIAESQGEGRNFLALLDVDRAAAEELCLDEAIYFESRGESEAGQAAVAQVVLNRVESGHYPASICGVVYQNRRRHNACQFSFACQGKTLRVTEPVSWKTAVRIAREVLLGGDYSAEVAGSTHYLADYAHPRWAQTLQRMDVIGHHTFYQAAPAATLVCVRHVGDRGIGFAPIETVEVNSPG